MIRAAALNMVIVIALVIGIICASLVGTAYFFQSQHQQQARYHRLTTNLASGTNILLADPDTLYRDASTDLFNNQVDSVALQKVSWGIYDIGVVRAWQQKDTLSQIFMLANDVDSAKWGVLYLSDQDRPVSLSGNTSLKGDAFLPKAGVRTAFVENKAYTGDKRLIIGKQKASEKQIPALSPWRLKRLWVDFTNDAGSNAVSIKLADSMSRSFMKPTWRIELGNKVDSLRQTKLSGNIAVHSDTTLVIDSTAKLDNVIVYARSIIVRPGFTGRCQLFALDSVSVGKRCRFGYPSCIAVVRADSVRRGQAMVHVGAFSRVAGVLFNYEKAQNPLQPTINLDKHSTVSGNIYSQNALSYQDSVTVNGSLFTEKLLYRSNFTIYENYLINFTADEQKLSPYYLVSPIFPFSRSRKKILLWVEKS